MWHQRLFFCWESAEQIKFLEVFSQLSEMWLTLIWQITLKTFFLFYYLKRKFTLGFIGQYHPSNWVVSFRCVCEISFKNCCRVPWSRLAKVFLLYLDSYKINAILSRNSQKWQNAVLSFIGRYSVKMWLLQ